MSDLLVQGRLHTLDPENPVAGAALARDGRFVAVGGAAECAAQARPGAVRLELGEGSATPGLADAHGHVEWLGRSRLEVRCEGAGGEQECVARVAARARAVAPGRWIRGNGWNHELWADRRFPTLDALSAAVPDHPVVLTRADGHAVWANARALELAGIRRDSPDPGGGRIVRGPDGRPEGVLVDRAADLVLRRVPAPSPAELEEALLLAMRELVRAGLTAVHDAGVGAGALEAYRRLAEQDRLPLRVYAMIDGQAPRDRLEQQLAHWARTPEVGRLSVRAVKLFADGALASRGAALLEPYADDPGNAGLLVTPPDELRERIALVARAGFQPAVHAIGDRACAEVLEAFASADRALRLSGLRPRIEHLQTLLARHVPLLARSGAIASMQPIHAVMDARWAIDRLGAGTARLRGAYAWRQALDAGATLAFGSDFPVESFDPRLGLAAAELRRPPGAQGAWMPEQRLTRAEALRAYARGPAIAALGADRRGMIKVGWDADLTVFGADVMAVPAEELPSLAVTHAIVAGRIEHQAPGRAGGDRVP